MEIDLILDSKVLDGRWANNAWLQEAPEATTKLTWDNAAQLSPATARRLGLWTQDMVSISAAGGGTLTAPVWVAPGLADDVVVLPLGYGRSAGGSVLAGSGFDGFSLRNANLHWFAAGASVAKAEGQYELASTQNHDRAESWRSNGGDRLEARPGMPPRPIIREASFATWKDEPAFVEKSEMLPESRLHSLWVHPNVTGGQQWGMSVDLTTCTGCATCVVACIAENNIQVVGKLEMLRGREMHWIRVDRYFTGSEDDPQAVVQPMLCLQCETAPCESVCPVAATSHSPEGLNDMAYNRCIGTRYCANNCPVKIRRFNFFNYSKRAEEANPLLQLQRNPDVSVRFRGVMEKCTYCVQRINAAKIEAKREGDGVVPDGRIVPACVQACPSEALVFGDIRDPESRVSKSKARAHEYAILAELNLHARTTYVAKIRNPNPDLA
jgi:molybdopterin-containing oxidoreductase family iron-sulfur binding subunit